MTCHVSEEASKMGQNFKHRQNSTLIVDVQDKLLVDIDNDCV